MASWQAHLLVMILKFQVKRKLKKPGLDILEARRTLGAVKHRVPPDLRHEQATVGGIGGEWIRPAQPSGGTLLYLHGGGYFACSPETHRPVTTAFARRGLSVFVPDYRLAPEHPFPAAVEDALAAYRGLVASGIPPETIVVSGDSAGGGLSLALMLSLRDAGEALPAAAALLSPWTDLAATGESIKTNTRRDAMFSGEAMGRELPYLPPGTDPRTPLASPLYAELHGLPPMLVHAGSYEVLMDDSVRLVDRVRKAGGTADLKLWPVVPHVWQLFGIPESKESLRELGSFLLEKSTAKAALKAA